MMQKATRKHTRLHNSRLVLKTIYDEGHISRADLARATHLTKATISTLVNHLMEAGLVEETGLGPSLGGKPPRLLRLDQDARQMLCLDLSSSYFRAALVNLRGEIGYRQNMATHGRGGQIALSLVYDLVDELLHQAPTPILGIGIGTAGLVDTQNGIIQSAVNLGWHDLPLKSLLEERYSLPVYLGNDSHLAALACYSFEAHETQNLVLIKAGRGIGAGIVLGGQLHVGDNFGAGEIGHVTVVENGESCRCGNHGCLETVASINGILRQVSLQTGQLDPTWEYVVAAAQHQDPIIIDILHQAGRYMATAVAHLIGILNVNQILIAGQMVHAGQPFLDGLQTAVRQQVLPTTAAKTSIRYATFGDELVLMGASALILKQKLGII